MSKSTFIYLPQEEFQQQEWDMVCSDYSLEKNKNGFWFHHETDCQISVEKLKETNVHFDQYKWKILIDATTRKTEAFFGLVSIPYHCLHYLTKSVFYDPQTDKFIESIEDLERYSKDFLLAYTSIGKLDKLGLVDKDEKIKLEKTNITRK